MKIKEFYLSHKLPCILGTAFVLGMMVLVVFCLQMRQRVAVTEPTEIFIPSGSNYEELTDTLLAHNIIESELAFHNVARSRNLPEQVKGGRYVVQPGTSIFRLVNKLRSGNQDAVRLTLGKYRTQEQLCGYLSERLEMQKDSMLALLRSDSVIADCRLTRETMLCLFVPNTYEVYWNTSPEKLLQKMRKEYDRFWTPVRRGQCNTLGLSQTEVMTLASIVEEETNQDDERATVASVYLNRLRLGMPLQADPTVKYAVGDFTLRRILNKHLAVESPYNTYRYKGLPPGPICTPSIKSIDAVLSNKKTDYLYFCAKEDFSGHHNFARTPTEHMQNAHRFHQALNQRGIK